jgi:4-amino-4-deoxy-L-arabinose transferase-like glycosyltransferase
LRRISTFAAALTGVAFAVPLLATRSGIGVSPDSVDYFVAAQSLARDGTLTDITGQAMTNWPPAYPALLWLGPTFGVAAETVARFANAVAFAAVVWLTYVLLRRHVGRSAVVAAGLALVVAAPALARLSDMMLSEMLFCVSVVGFTLILEQLVANPRRFVLLLSAAALVWAAFLLRYAGAFLVPAGVVALWWRDRRPAVRRLATSAGFVALAALVPALWVLRNAATDAPALGVRYGAGWDLDALATRFSSAVGYLVAPAGIDQGLAVLVAAAMAVGIGAALVASRTRGAAVTGARSMAPLVTVVGSYCALAIVGNANSGSDLTARVLAPVFPLLVVVGCHAYSRVDRQLTTSRGRSFLRLTSAAVVVLVGFEVLTMARQVHQHGRAGRGYAAPGLRRSALLHDLPARGAVIFSNDPWAVAYVGQRLPVALAPRRRAAGLSHPPAVPCDLASAGRRAAYLLWFDHAPGGGPGAPRFRVPGAGTVELVRVAEHSDGTLYSIGHPSDALRRACEG